MLSTTVVTPQRRHNYCKQRRSNPDFPCGCLCWARQEQNCTSCKLRIYLGDCLTHNGVGWCHSACPIGNGRERGVVSIEAGFTPVNYSQNLLGGSPQDPSLVLGGMFDLEAQDSKRSAEEVDDGSNKKIKAEASRSEEENSEDNYAKTHKRTNEQLDILSYEPAVGEIVAINAYAGCAKTTTSAMLCNKIAENHPDDKIGYFTFNKSLEEEARQSNKFPKNKIEIRTTHAFALRHYFGVKNQHKVDPVPEYRLEDIIEKLKLNDFIIQTFRKMMPSEGEKRKKELDRRAKTIARYVRKTVNNFESSEHASIDGKHVDQRARKAGKSKRTKWKSQVSAGQYIRWATQFFDCVKKKCEDIRQYGNSSCTVKISHDGYLKVAQLDGLQLPYNWVFIDEAQDLTACQANLFWGNSAGKRIYLLGDCYQQIYGFRGASFAFRDMMKQSISKKFTLTGSFRFGRDIAAYATCVLKALGGDVLKGRAIDNGIIEVDESDGESTMTRGIVLCRTQNGMLKYLHSKKPVRWCYLGGSANLAGPIKMQRWQYSLESFLKEEQPSFTYRNEKFKSIEDIKEFIDEENDIELSKSLVLLEYLVSKEMSLDEFYSELKESFCPMNEGETPENYQGIIMSTVHRAKGLEFSCPVLIHDDFNFKAITSAVIDERLHCSESNHLYVAISRAKRHLVLSQMAKHCIDLLAEKSCFKLPSTFTKKRCNDMYNAWDAQWNNFRDDKSSTEIPYPPQWDNDESFFALHPRMNASRQRKMLHNILRRFHPDKFLPRFKRRIDPSERDEVKQNLEQITRKCNEILESLRGQDGDSDFED